MSKRKVLANYFSDRIGYMGNDLYDGSYWYAELSKDPNSFDYTTLGGLEYKQILKITYKGKTAYAYKGDERPGDSNHSEISLHHNLAVYLQLEDDFKYVYIEKVEEE